MRLMYDAVTAANIPINAKMVAGYCDTIRIPQWTDGDWARFPNAIKIRIAKKASTNDGHVLDVEIGDATPAQAPGWVVMRRKAGIDPVIYCNMSTWGAVRDAFVSARVAEPQYWIAHYDGIATLPAGAIAKQYDNPGPYDLSVVADDFWTGTDMPFTKDDFNFFMWGNVFDTLGNQNFAGWLKNHVAKIETSNAALTAAVAALSTDPHITLDAMRTLVNDAVAQHISITGDVHIGPAGPA